MGRCHPLIGLRHAPFWTARPKLPNPERRACRRAWWLPSSRAASPRVKAERVFLEPSEVQLRFGRSSTSLPFLGFEGRHL